MSSNIQALIRVRNNNRNNIIVGTNLQLEVRSHPFFFIILFIQFDQNCFSNRIIIKMDSDEYYDIIKGTKFIETIINFQPWRKIEPKLFKVYSNKNRINNINIVEQNIIKVK